MFNIPFIPVLITHDSNDDAQWSDENRTLRQCLLQSMIETAHKQHIFRPKSRYLKYRRILVDWMSEVGEVQHLQTTTVHMAVAFLDRILGTHVESKKRLQLVAMACILIVARMMCVVCV